jgi:6-phosphogluconolactonase
MKTWIVDPENVILIPGDEEETLRFAADSFIKTCQRAIEDKGRAFVALSGGSTPKAIFQRLDTSKVDGNKVFLFWSDERTVPPDHPDSNYHMAMTSGPFKKWVPEDQIFFLQNEEAYESKIKELVPDGIFDLILLGMGDDGHTASLFPDSKALQEKERWVVDNWVEKLKTHRLTFTFPLIQRAKEKVIYLIGSKKAKMAREVLIDHKGRYPAERIGTEERPATWILDEPAAALLDESC